MSYALVHDRKEVEKFESLFYSKTNDGYERVFLMYISARNKYCPELSNNGCFKRTVIRYNDRLEDHRRLFNDIQHYEIPLHAYKDKNHRAVVPQEALALYASINPRNAVHAAQDLTKEILDMTFLYDKAYFSSIDQKFKNKLQKHSVNVYVGIDLDTKDEEVYQELIADITRFVNIYVVIETHGGYHIIIPKRELQRTFNGMSAGQYLYKALPGKYKALDKVSNDLFSPIPGTIQGGFKVRFRDV